MFLSKKNIELKESEEHAEIIRAKLTHTTNNQETEDLKVAALYLILNRFILAVCVKMILLVRET